MRFFVFECLRLSGFFKVAWLEKRIQLSVLRVTDHQLSKKRKRPIRALSLLIIIIKKIIDSTRQIANSRAFAIESRQERIHVKKYSPKRLILSSVREN